MAEIGSESQFFSGNIANMIPEGPLNEMVPLSEDHGGGGGGGGARGPPLALTDYNRSYFPSDDDNKTKYIYSLNRHKKNG